MLSPAPPPLQRHTGRKGMVKFSELENGAFCEIVGPSASEHTAIWSVSPRFLCSVCPLVLQGFQRRQPLKRPE